MNRELISSTAFIRAARRYLKKHAQAADDPEAVLLLLSKDAFDPRSELRRSGKATAIPKVDKALDLEELE